MIEVKVVTMITTFLFVSQVTCLLALIITGNSKWAIGCIGLLLPILILGNI